MDYSQYAIRENCIMLGTEHFVPSGINVNDDRSLFFSEYFYKLNCALNWPKKLIFFHDVPSLATEPSALEILLETVSHQPWLKDRRPPVEPNMDVVIVFGGKNEALPVECVKVVAEFAKVHSTIPCYYLSGAEPVPITFECFKEYRGDAHNLKLITANTFERDHVFVDDAYLNYKRDFDVTRSHKFHFFVGKPRFHRYFLLALLAERKVLDKGILSYGWCTDMASPQSVLNHMLTSPQNEEYLSYFPHLLRVSEKHLPNMEPVQSPYPNANNLVGDVARIMDRHDTAVYDNTYFYVSTETSNLTSTNLDYSEQVPSTRSLFYTEKTYRPLMLRQMGITCGQQGHLKGLKNRGYKPFEQYNNSAITDMIYNDEERLIAQADAICDMCNWPDTLLTSRLEEFTAKAGNLNRDKIINSAISIMAHPH